MEIKNINLIPEGEKPIIHASQFDENRSIRFDLKDGAEDFTLTSDLVVTCNIKKVDGNIVTFEVENTESTYVVITLPLQATACAGPNVGEIVITDEDNFIIGTINFILEVERSPMLGGIESESDIHDLEEQIEVIVTQVIATDYYTKSEVDNLLNEKADISDLPDMDNYYDKSSVDTLLNGKVNTSDLNNYYNKTQVDNKLDQKANISDLPDMSDYYNKAAVDNMLANKADISDLPDMSNYYTKTQIDNKFLDIMPVNNISGAVANFTTLIVAPLVALKSYIKAQGGGGTPSAPVAITGVSEVNIYRRGVNLWDEQTEVSGNRLISKNYIPVVPSLIYHFVMPSELYNAQGLTIYLYNKNKTLITTRTMNSVNYGANANMTMTSETYFLLFAIATSYGTTYNNDISINYPSTDTSYHTYNPQSDTFTLPLGQTIYGGYVDWENGKLVLTWGYITSYNGETLTGEWLSSMDTYSQGTTPTIGAEVAYELAIPIELSLPTTMPQTISGEQNWFADSGDIEVSFKQGIQEYIDAKIAETQALIL